MTIFDCQELRERNDMYVPYFHSEFWTKYFILPDVVLVAPTEREWSNSPSSNTERSIVRIRDR
jgi:hypothetical protein